MDYIRQQIEASLGRSEELLISDKARRNFYRYPPDPGLPKKLPKERGTFNSVRLKKYLGLGSKKKQKLDSDDLQQQLQQRAYLEELKRYGPMPPAVPFAYCDGQVQLFTPPPQPLSLYPAERYRDAWMYGAGTVCGGRKGRYPNVYASVNIRSPRQRGALQAALCSWEPYLHSPPPPIRAELPPPPVVFDVHCTCGDPMSKSKKHRNKCTCGGGGTKSRRTSKHTSRPPLLSSSDSSIDYVKSSAGALMDNNRVVASENAFRKMPLDGRVSIASSNASSRRTLETFQKSSAIVNSKEDDDSFDFVESVLPQRKSILECPVNPYELMSMHQKTRRKSAPPRLDGGSYKKTFSSTPHFPLTSSKTNLKEQHNKVNVSKSFDVGSSSPEDIADISLGGQRIRLFGTVRGTMSFSSNSSPKKRPLLPSFSRKDTSEPSCQKRNGFTSYVDFCALSSTRVCSERSLCPNRMDINKVMITEIDDDWEEDGNLKKTTSEKASIRKSTSNCSNVVSYEEYGHGSLPCHKTTIQIGGRVEDEEKEENENKTIFIRNQNLRDKSAILTPGTATKSQSEGQLEEVSGDKASYESIASACQTVISVDGQVNVESSPAASSRPNCLNLRINFSELSAYLKPILKKASFNESSTSSEADTSESFGCSIKEIVDIRQKQKKHVHFLSNRTSAGSEESLESSLGASFTSDDDNNAPLDVSTEHSTNEESPNLLDVQDVSSSSNTVVVQSSKEVIYYNVVGRPLDDNSVENSSLDSSNLYDDIVCVYNNADELESTNEANSTTETLGVNNKVLKRQEKIDSLLPRVRSEINILPKQVTTIKLNSERDEECFLRQGSKRSSLCRSQSERYVLWPDDKTATTTTSSKSRSPPARSHSFQCFESLSCLPSSTSIKNYSLGNSHCMSMSSTSVSMSSEQDKLSTVDDLDFLSDMPKNLSIKNVSNNSNGSCICRRMEEEHAYRGCHRDFAVKDGQRFAVENFQSNRALHQQLESSPMQQLLGGDVQQQQLTTPRSLDIAKLKTIPKFLPRPFLRSKHVPSCSFHSSGSSEVLSRCNNSSSTGSDDSGWNLNLSSEDGLYADGSSVWDERIANKPLPPAPLHIVSDVSSSLNDNFDDQTAIYEQIRDVVEPLYEEVPDTVSCNSSSLSSVGQPRKSIFEGASRLEILNYLEDAKERGLESIDSAVDDPVVAGDRQPEELVETSRTLGAKRNHRNRISNISNLSDSSHTSEDSFQNDESKETKDRQNHSSAEVERNDSGVGSETSKPSRLRRQSRLGSSYEQLCVDCDQTIEPVWDNEGGTSIDALVCRKCSKKRSERKEIILEIYETETKYGRDLKIIKEEFHRPMLVAGLLSEDLLNNIFLNLDQLVGVNEIFAEKLKDALDIAAEQGDEDYSTLNVGKIFQDSSAMLHSFEAYCIRQGTASILLTNLEKEKELLRIFLKVSQMENTLLRRLNLSSFLMVPVQRITKYPLLINRLYKVTPHHHQDREALRDAQLKIEMHLDRINQQAKDFSGMNLWRRISSISNPQRKSLLEPVLGNVKLRKMALQMLQWNTEEVRFAMEGRLLYAVITDNVWNKREKTLKLMPIHGLLVTLGTPNENYRPDLADRELLFPKSTGIKETTLVLIKEKSSRFSLLREPLFLQRCVVSSEPDSEDIFEIQELTTKDAYLLKAEDSKDTSEWLKLLRYHAKDLGAWRRRRNALANIMINGMVAHREWL